MENSQKNKIVIVGGGYGGLKALQALAKDPKNEICLIDKNAFHFMQTDVYDLIANECDFADMTLDLFTFCMGFDTNVTFLKQDVKEIDFKKKKVISDVQRVSYDYLIIAVGARTKFVDSIPGLKEYAHGIKTLHRAMYFKQKFEMSLFKKVENEGFGCSPINIIVAGAGLSGVEIAAQMASFAKEFYENNHFLCRKLDIVLVNSATHILKGLDEPLMKASQKRLDALGVTVKHSTRVVSLTQNSVTLTSGEVLDIDFMIFAGGIEPNGLVYNLDLSKNQFGFIEVNENLQSIDYEDVFVVGDCTTIYDANEKRLAPTADIAEQMGIHAAKNIQNMQNNKPLEKHSIVSRGILIALGRRYASAKISKFFLDGFFAYVMKKLVEKSYFYLLQKRSVSGCKKIFCDPKD